MTSLPFSTWFWGWSEVKWSEVAPSYLTLCDPWTIAYQAYPYLGFSRQEYWSGLPFPSPGDLPDLTHRTQVSRFAGRHFILWATRVLGVGVYQDIIINKREKYGQELQLLRFNFYFRWSTSLRQLNSKGYFPIPAWNNIIYCIYYYFM